MRPRIDDLALTLYFTTYELDACSSWTPTTLALLLGSPPWSERSFQSPLRRRQARRHARSVLIVRSALEFDTGPMQDIERLAGYRFREVGLAEIADDEPPSLQELRRHAREGRCWVVVGASGEPAGYVMVSDVDGHAHVDQMSVHPEHQGRGAGRALIDRVRTWALKTGRDVITLTTYADVPWNRPLYEHLGFRVLDENEIGSELRAIRDAERARGLDVRPRVCMCLDPGSSRAHRPSPNDRSGAMTRCLETPAR